MPRQFKLMILVNVVLSLLLFLSSVLVLSLLNGKIVEGIGIFIDYGFVYSGAPAPTIHAPLPNYPLFVFIIALVVNIYFIIKLNRQIKPTT